MKQVVLLLIILMLIISPVSVKAEILFNPSFILSNEEMADYLSLNLAQIQLFLEERGSSLAWRSMPDYLGVTRPASEIIWQAAIESKISPKVILTTLQKEQSLIGDSTPSQNQLDKAMGYRCPDSGSCSPKALGFGKQVDGATWQFRQYMNNPNDWFYKANQDYIIDGWLVTPLTTATAGLYNYTPHYSGNSRFWQLWQNYWGRDFPDGSLVKTPDSPAVWLIQYGTKRLITSWGVLISRFDPKKILTISSIDLNKYETGPSLKFYNYSLLQDPEGKVYLLADDELRHITSPEVFRTIGFNPEEIQVVEDLDLVGYKYGKDITVETAYPTGALLQDKTTGGVYYVESGIKHPIYAKEIMTSRFSSKVLTSVAPESLDQYQLGQPVKFRDGELIQAQDDLKVYIISDGYRRWVKSEEAFAKFSYKWDNIIITTAQAVNIHPLGEDLE